MTDQQPGTIELAVAKLSEITAVGLAEIKGQLALLMQRADHADWRVDQLTQRQDADRAMHAAEIEALEKRVDAIERDGVTRPQLAESRRQLIGIFSVIVAVISVIVTVVGLIIARV
ncbi:hypothetical protein [Nonomuraea ceibae]|uniref:hypothetical protein n=1 Tax=Nonomuraea ceibae TaxID=1935170 RepID=UPI001C5D358F|nr:hypothetical protein [Nonomuraea ceibae]